MKAEDFYSSTNYSQNPAQTRGKMNTGNVEIEGRTDPTILWAFQKQRVASCHFRESKYEKRKKCIIYSPGGHFFYTWSDLTSEKMSAKLPIRDEREKEYRRYHQWFKTLLLTLASKPTVSHSSLDFNCARTNHVTKSYKAALVILSP